MAVDYTVHPLPEFGTAVTGSDSTREGARFAAGSTGPLQVPLGVVFQASNTNGYLDHGQGLLPSGDV